MKAFGAGDPERGNAGISLNSTISAMLDKTWSQIIMIMMREMHDNLEYV